MTQLKFIRLQEQPSLRQGREAVELGGGVLTSPHVGDSLRQSLAVASLFALLGALSLLAAACQPWWHVIGMAEPSYFRIAHVIAAISAVMILSALAFRRFRSGLFSSGLLLGIATLMLMVSLGVLLGLALFDAPAIGNAVEQLDQANSLISTLTRTAINPQIPWTETTAIATGGLRRNDYTVADVLETAMHFAQAGWFLACLGGLLLLFAAWLLDGNAVRRILFAVRLPAVGAVLICLAVLFGRFGVSLVYWNNARTAQAQANFAAALQGYRCAARWDPRLEYDRFYHFNLGRVYQALRLQSEPDYWALLGDIDLSQAKPLLAYQVYRDHIPSPDSNPALRFRYADMLYQVGSYHYMRKEYASAVTCFQQSLRLDPNNVLAKYGLALGCTKIGNFSRAIPLWQSLIQDNEGVSLYRSKYVVSGFAYRKVITARAWSCLAWCYYRQHDTPHALLCQANATVAGSVPLDMAGD